MPKVAINGFGRIGRQAAKLILEHHPTLELVAVNDVADAATLTHLLKYDTIYGSYVASLTVDGSGIAVKDREIRVLNEKDPAQLPWAELGIDVVIESTGKFTDVEGAGKHLTAGAKAVIISAPSNGEKPAPTFVMGINQEGADAEPIINNASCTTNCIAPTIQVLQDAFGVEKALMTTVHGYTQDQVLQDGPHKDLRRGRAAAMNIVPTTTGAALATTEVIPELKGVFDGVSLRVPVITGSISDITAVLKTEVTVAKVNEAFRQAAESDRFKGILDVTEDPIVSSDIIGNPHSAIVDLGLTQVIGNLVKVFAWYDNEYGYACRLVEMVEQLATAQNRP